MRITAPAVLLLLLTACGGGGGGGGAIQPGTGGAPGGPVVLGSRTVPGHAITVTRGAASTGTTSLTIQVASDAGLSVSGVGVRFGATYVDGASFSAATPSGAGNWSVTLPSPSVVAGQRVWVRVTESDGTVTESGVDDFSLR